jgi:hypothetical protein
MTLNSDSLLSYRRRILELQAEIDNADLDDPSLLDLLDELSLVLAHQPVRKFNSNMG